MSNFDINVETDGDGRTDGRKIGRLYRTLLQAGAIKSRVRIRQVTLYITKAHCFVFFLFCFLYVAVQTRQSDQWTLLTPSWH